MTLKHLTQQRSDGGNHMAPDLATKLSSLRATSGSVTVLPSFVS